MMFQPIMSRTAAPPGRCALVDTAPERTEPTELPRDANRGPDAGGQPER